MFHRTLQEANRLGIKIGVHNCDGWSETGETDPNYSDPPQFNVSANDTPDGTPLADGEKYKKITEFGTSRFYVTDIIKIPRTKARFFKIEVRDIFDIRPWHHAALAELDLLGDDDQPAYHHS